MIHQIDCKNEWLLLSASFTAKFGLVFVLTLEKTFCLRFHFKANRKSISSSKNGTRDFQNNPRFERLACFYVTLSGNFERLQTKNYFKKLECRFLVESIKIENALFPYKTAILEANVTTNSMISTKWTYHKKTFCQ